MPDKKYKYQIVITNTIDNSGVKKGVDGLEKELTRAEKQQKKLEDWYKKNAKLIEAAMKAAEIAAKMATQAFTDFQKMMAGLNAEVGKLKTSFDALKTSIEAAANAKRKFGNTFGTGGGGGSGGKLVFDTTEAEKSIITLIKKKESLFNPSKIQIAAPNLDTIEKNLEGILNSIKNLGKTKTTIAPQLTETEKAANKAASMVLRLDNQIAKLSGNDTELGKLNRQLSQSGIASKIDETTKAILRQKAATADALKAQNGKSSFAGDVFKSAFAGASLAGLAAAAITITLNTIKSAITAGYDQAVAAGITAAGFERTKIALSGVIGSATQANIEIANLEKTAQNTKGLTFQTALDGYQRLRAVQFGAKDAERALVGLSKVKILSGGTKEDLEAVLINFAQIRSVGKLTGDELRETLGRFPYFAQVLQKAFGTISTEKIGELGLSSDEFFQRIFEQLDKVPTASGGASEAFDKLTDSFFKAQVAFGTPLLEPATDAIINLTSILDQNKDTFKIWGGYVGDILRGVSSEIQTIKNGFDVLNGASNSPVAAGIYNGVQIAVGSMVRGNGGSLSRRGAELRRLKEGAETSKDIGIDPNEIFDFSKGKAKDDERVRNYKQFLKNLDDAEKVRLQNVENFYSQQQAVINSGLKYTLADELEVQKKISQSQVSENQAKINSLKKFISDARTLNKSLADSFSNPQDKKKIEAQKELELLPKLAQLDKLRGDAFKEELSNRQRVLELEKRIADQKRQSLIDFKNLQIAEAQTFRDNDVFNISDSIEFGIISATDGFNRLRSLTQSSYEEISRLTSERYQTQLEDLSLTNEQRINLMIEMYSAERKLAEENQRAIDDIQTKQFQRSADLIKQQAEQSIKGLQGRGQLFRQLSGGFFENSIQFGQGFKTFGQGKLDLTTEIGLNEKLNGVLSGKTSIYEVQADLLKKSHIAETAALQREIDLNKDLIALERIKAKSQINQNIITALGNRATLLSQADRLAESNPTESQNLRNRAESFGIIARDFQTLLEKSEADLNAYLDTNSAAIKAYNNQIQGLNQTAESLGVSQAGEKQSLFANSTEGLKKFYETLKSGALDAIVLQTSENNAWQEKISLILENKNLETEYYKDTEFLALQRRNKQLQYERDIFEIRQELANKSVFNEVEASAKILAHIEQNTKSASDIFADSFITAFDLVSDKMDSFYDKFGIGKIPIIGDIVKAQSRNLLGSLSQTLLGDIFPDIGNSNNPILNENQKQTKSLQNIEKAVTGVGSLTNIGGGSTSSNGSGGGGIAGLFKKFISIFTGNRGGGSSPATQAASVNSNSPLVGASQVLTSDPFIQGIMNGSIQMPDYRNGDSGGGGFFSKITGEGGIFGEKGFGNNVGTFSTIGAGVGIVGGLIGGRVGRGISYAGTGLALGAQLGSIIPGIGTALGAAIGAGVGALIGLFTGGTRKKDEKTRTQGMVDALGALDKLIASVNNDPDFTDAAGVISQGEQIKQSYLDMANGLKDKKTRNIAIKDFSRVEAKFRELETLAKTKAAKTKSRAESLQLDVPTFADGGAISNFAMQNFPGGFITGPGSARSDSILARISNGEYILDGKTTKAIGRANLDALRASEGRLFKYMREPLMKFADGGGIGMVDAGSQSGSPLAGFSVKNDFQMIWNEAEDSGTLTGQTTLTKDATGEQWVIDTVAKEINRNRRNSKIVKANNDANAGK